MRNLYIPPLRTTIILASEWTFPVYDEWRNQKLLDYVGWKRQGGWATHGTAVAQCAMPAGTELVVDRIYIRSGAKAFNSVTFRARNYSNNPVNDKTGRRKREPVLRFWVKLDDANRIEMLTFQEPVE